MHWQKFPSLAGGPMGDGSANTMSASPVTTELKATLGIALPLAGAQLSQVLMGFISAVMMGRLGGDALAAGGLGTTLYFSFVLVFQGVLTAVGPLVAYALGAGEEERVGGIVAHGILIAATLAAIGVAALGRIDAVLAAIGQGPALVAATQHYLDAAIWGFPAGLGFVLLRTYLSALSRTWPIMLVLLACLVADAVLTYALIFGRLGAPSLGIVGAGYASAATQWLMFGGLALYAANEKALRHHGVLRSLSRPRWQEALPILRLGWPIAGMIAIEIGVFTGTALLAGLLGTASLAAHQIAIGIVSLTFMVPLAFTHAATVRVALALGAHRVDAARRAGIISFVCGVGFMAMMAVILLVTPGAIVALYLDRGDPANEAAIAIALRLLFIAALFQIFDGAQTIAIGALRGLRDTRVPLLVGAVGYWAIGVPVGWLLAFPVGLGAIGLWWGLALGLAAVAIPLGLRFHRLTASY
jgi:MATE family multidrug resistance protein